MNLTQKSWHAKLYKIFYGSLPPNFCPYFWKIILAIILFIPLFTWVAPSLLVAIIAKKAGEDDILDGPNYWLNSMLWMKALLMNLILMFISCMLLMWITWTGNEPVFAIGITGWSIVLIMIGVGIHQTWKESRPAKSYKAPKVKKPNIFVEFIKAKYEKNCPLINWE